MGGDGSLARGARMRRALCAALLVSCAGCSNSLPAPVAASPTVAVRPSASPTVAVRPSATPGVAGAVQVALVAERYLGSWSVAFTFADGHVETQPDGGRWERTDTVPVGGTVSIALHTDALGPKDEARCRVDWVDRDVIVGLEGSPWTLVRRSVEQPGTTVCEWTNTGVMPTLPKEE